MKDRMKDTDSRLREKFQALRRAEAPGAPSFGATRASAMERDARLPGRLLLGRPAWAALGALIFVVGAAAALYFRRPAAPSVEEAIAQARELQAWTAPTDSLLILTDLGNSNLNSVAPPDSSPSSGETATQPTQSPD